MATLAARLQRVVPLCLFIAVVAIAFLNRTTIDSISSAAAPTDDPPEALAAVLESGGDKNGGGSRNSSSSSSISTDTASASVANGSAAALAGGAARGNSSAGVAAGHVKSVVASLPPTPARPPRPHHHHPQLHTPPPPTRPVVASVAFQLPARHVYRANHPLPLFGHAVAAVRELAGRNWTGVIDSTTSSSSSSSSGSGSGGGGGSGPELMMKPKAHLVVRLPNSDFAAELRPFPRMLATLSLLLAAEEAGMPDPVATFEQLHFLAPVAPALMRGAGGGSSSGAPTTAKASAADVVGLAEWDAVTPLTAPPPPPPAAAAAAAAASAPMMTVVDRDGVKWVAWTVHLEEQGPEELFARPWAGMAEDAAGSASASAKRARQQELREARGVLERGVRGGGGGVAGAVVDLGAFGREGGSWQEAFGLLEARRAERLRAMALRLCRVSPPPSSSPAAATAEGSVAAGGGGGGESAPPGPRPLRVVVYNRDATRRLRHAHEAAAALQARLPAGSEVRVVTHREDRPVCELAALLAEADALVTPHGFSAVLATFLPPHALLVEIMPYHFGAFPIYGKLAGAFGVEYLHVHSEPVRKLQPALLDIIAPLFLPGHDPRRCKDSALCRFLARQFPVKLEEEQVQALAARVQDVGARRRQRVHLRPAATGDGGGGGGGGGGQPSYS